MEPTSTRGQNIMLTKQRLALTWQGLSSSINRYASSGFYYSLKLLTGSQGHGKTAGFAFFIVRRRPFPTRKTILQNKTVNLFILACSGPTKGLLWITEWDFKAWSAFDWLYIEGSYLVGYDIPPIYCRGCPSQTNHNRLLTLNPRLLHNCAFLAVACTTMESISTCRFGSRLPWSFLSQQVLRNKKTMLQVYFYHFIPAESFWNMIVPLVSLLWVIIWSNRSINIKNNGKYNLLW